MLHLEQSLTNANLQKFHPCSKKKVLLYLNGPVNLSSVGGCFSLIHTTYQQLWDDDLKATIKVTERNKHFFFILNLTIFPAILSLLSIAKGTHRISKDLFVY